MGIFLSAIARSIRSNYGSENLPILALIRTNFPARNSNQNRQLSTPINRTLAGDGISAINGIGTPLISASVWRVGTFQIVGGT